MKKATPQPSLADAIAATDSRADSIQVKIRKLDAELSNYTQKLSTLHGAAAASTKRRALQCLRQKKMYEAQLDTLTAQSMSMEQTHLTTENMRNTMTTVTALTTANKTLKKEYGKISIEKIERMQDEMADLIESANELSEVMGRSMYDVGDGIDEDELEAELDALASEDPGVLGLGEGRGDLSYLTSEAEAPPDFIDEDEKTKAATVPDVAS